MLLPHRRSGISSSIVWACIDAGGGSRLGRRWSENLSCLQIARPKLNWACNNSRALKLNIDRWLRKWLTFRQTPRCAINLFFSSRCRTCWWNRAQWTDERFDNRRVERCASSRTTINHRIAFTRWLIGFVYASAIASCAQRAVIWHAHFHWKCQKQLTQ